MWDQTIFLGAGSGLARSKNKGVSWSVLLQQNVLSVALSPNFATDATLFLTTGANTILMSTNGGQT
ncbi:MAG: hypothetical protein WA532_06425, partial [Candidatus Korobacteraceae bacterium]